MHRAGVHCVEHAKKVVGAQVSIAENASPECRNGVDDKGVQPPYADMASAGERLLRGYGCPRIDA